MDSKELQLLQDIDNHLTNIDKNQKYEADLLSKYINQNLCVINNNLKNVHKSVKTVNSNVCTTDHNDIVLLKRVINAIHTSI